SAATRGGASRRASRWSVRPPRRSRCTKSCSARAVFHSLERREVTQCHALVAALLEQPREVEVGLGDRRLACERRLIFAHGLVDRTLVLEHDTEIEVCDAVLRRERNRLAIERFGLVEGARGVPHPAEID